MSFPLDEVVASAAEDWETVEEVTEKEEKEPLIDDDELKKLNRKVPDARSTFKKDDVDKHFDR